MAASRTEELALRRPADFAMRGRALCLERRFTDAVTVYKEGLALAPDDEELQKGLRAARLAVLDALADADDDESDAGGNGDGRGAWFATPQASEGDAAVTALWTRSQPPAATERALVFEAKVDRLLGHLDVAKLSRLATLYVLTELLQLRRVTLGLALLLLGVFGQALVHRHKFMVASILFLCMYQSKVRLLAWRRVDAWAHASTDKLGAFTWAPRVACLVPVAMKVFGLLRFMVFLQRDWTLSLLVAVVAGALVIGSFQSSAGEPLQVWGQGKRLKFAAYAVAIAYWGVWRGEGGDILRLLPGALVDAGGIVLGSLPPAEIQGAVRRAWEKLYAEVAGDIQQDVEFDAWFVLGLGRWVVDYWQQPSDFSLETLAKMLAEGFSSLEASAVHVFRPELRHLKRQMAHLSESDEMAVLVAYLKKSLDEIPPPKSVGMIGLFAKRCPSFVVLALLFTFYGTLSLPLVPFLVSELEDAQCLYSLYASGEAESLDGLEILLLGSPLLRVWENLRAAVYCLEGSVTLSKAMATGTQIITAAARLSRLATFTARLKSEGVVANAHELPDHITSALQVARESNTIVEGIRHVCASAHFQDLQAHVANWWRRTLSSAQSPPAAAAASASDGAQKSE